jgi:hypothetical protein
LARRLRELLDDPPAADTLREACIPYSIDNSARGYLAALGLL